MPKGRTHGSLNEQIYKWRIGILDRETGETLYNKYCSINEFNRMHMMKVTSHVVCKSKKLTLEERVNPRRDSYAERFGHLTFEKIDEPVIYIKTRIVD